MKNIKKLFRIFSIGLLVLTLLCSSLLVGCTETDDHEGHDHDHEEETVSIFKPLSSVTLSKNYPDVSVHSESVIKKVGTSTSALVLRIVKIDGDQIYCTAGRSHVADHILIAPTVDVKEGDFLLTNATVYTITSERLGFDAGSQFSILYVVYGSEMNDLREITEKQANSIFASLPQ